jgi:predicted benzoate:H+ symporter BenE
MIIPFDPFLDLLFPHVLKQAQNGNRDSILAYSLFGRFLATGLIGALLTPYFQIPRIRAWNQK